jgi:hypothetical protein
MSLKAWSVPLLVSGALSGCSGIEVRDPDGTIHYLIVGIGVVSIPENSGEAGATVAKSQALGLQVSTLPSLKFAAGYSQSSYISVPESVENLVVELSQRPFGPLHLEMNVPAPGD